MAINVSDPLELQGNSLYTVGRNGLVTSFVVPTGEEPTKTVNVETQTRDILGVGVKLLLIFGVIFLLLQLWRR
jgi:hypothetical protein